MSGYEIPIFGNTGITQSDILAGFATAALSSFVLGGGFIVQTGLSFQDTLMTVGAVVGTHLIMKQVISRWRAGLPIVSSV